MKIEDLTIGRYYEITDIPKGSCWDEEAMTGNIVKAVEGRGGKYTHPNWILAIRVPKDNYTPHHAIYIASGSYRPLSIKETVKLDKELEKEHV